MANSVRMRGILTEVFAELNEKSIKLNRITGQDFRNLETSLGIEIEYSIEQDFISTLNTILLLGQQIIPFKGLTEGELSEFFEEVKAFVVAFSKHIPMKSKQLMDVYFEESISQATEGIDLGTWIYLGNGKFQAKEGTTLSHLEVITGRDWRTSDYKGEPEDLQIGQVVSFPATKEVNQTTSTALDNWIYLGNGKFEEKSEDVLNPPKLFDSQSDQWIVDDDGKGITAYYKRDTDIFAYHYVDGDSVADNIAKFIAPVSNAAAFLFNEPIAIADAIDKFLFSKGIDLNALNNIPDAYMLAQAARHIRYIVPVLKGVSVVEDVIKPMQIHHFATNKNKKYTPQFEKIVGKYKLNLDDGTWNTDILPHTGRHPDAYHDFVLGNMNEIDALANGDKQLFLELFDGLKNEIKSNPDMLYKAYWENIK